MNFNWSYRVKIENNPNSIFVHILKWLARPAIWLIGETSMWFWVVVSFNSKGNMFDKNHFLPWQLLRLVDILDRSLKFPCNLQIMKQIDMFTVILFSSTNAYTHMQKQSWTTPWLHILNCATLNRFSIYFQRVDGIMISSSF